MPRFVELPCERGYITTTVVARSSDAIPLEEVVERLIREIERRSPGELRRALGQYNLAGLYHSCVEDEDTISCKGFIESIWMALRGGELAFELYDVWVDRVGNDILYIEVSSVEIGLMKLYLKVEGDYSKRDVLHYIKQKLERKLGVHIYTVDDLKPQVEKLWQALRKKGVVD